MIQEIMNHQKIITIKLMDRFLVPLKNKVLLGQVSRGKKKEKLYEIVQAHFGKLFFVSKMGYNFYTII